ncbi:hypothetical protein NDU88_004868 [Pleurodeles waltl]|uniref:Uncharacterized protein n=1 Tax=Pleurodeles waltl TaxID=8319 RepID=A0AAV7M8C5_PLEWA|nr:hypothetical protein NDU88_004868 [Pleurodeles waltl]
MDFVSAVSEALAMSIPSNLRPTAEISWRRRSTVDSYAGSVMVWCRVVCCPAGAGVAPLSEVGHQKKAVVSPACLSSYSTTCCLASLAQHHDRSAMMWRPGGSSLNAGVGQSHCAVMSQQYERGGGLGPPSRASGS